jgi:hypothetical protein
MVIMLTGAPVLATAQTATPGASPEVVTEYGFQVITSSTTTIEPPVAGAVVLEIFHTELLIDPGGTVPGTFPHYGTVTVSVQSGSICYTVDEAPAATMSFLSTGYFGDDAAPSIIDCGVEREPCASVCAVPRGEPVLLEAGDSITHVIPLNVGPEDPGGLIHSYYNAGDTPAWVVVIEQSPQMFARSCHGGCY